MSKWQWYRPQPCRPNVTPRWTRVLVRPIHSWTWRNRLPQFQRGAEVDEKTKLIVTQFSSSSKTPNHQIKERRRAYPLLLKVSMLKNKYLNCFKIACTFRAQIISSQKCNGLVLSCIKLNHLLVTTNLDTTRKQTYLIYGKMTSTSPRNVAIT